MTIYVNTYDDLMFHEEVECRASLEETFIRDEFWDTLADDQELTKNIILGYIFGELNTEELRNQMTELYDNALDAFLAQYMEEIDEEEAKDYEAGGCDWGD